MPTPFIRAVCVTVERAAVRIHDAKREITRTADSPTTPNGGRLTLRAVTATGREPRTQAGQPTPDHAPRIVCRSFGRNVTFALTPRGHPLASTDQDLGGDLEVVLGCVRGEAAQVTHVQLGLLAADGLHLFRRRGAQDAQLVS